MQIWCYSHADISNKTQILCWSVQCNGQDKRLIESILCKMVIFWVLMDIENYMKLLMYLKCALKILLQEFKALNWCQLLGAQHKSPVNCCIDGSIKSEPNMAPQSNQKQFYANFPFTFQ